MSLKTATLIALICTGLYTAVHLLFSLGIGLGLIDDYMLLRGSLFSLGGLSSLLSVFKNTSITLFLGVLWFRQKRTE